MNNSQAELKDVKLGETLTSKVDGNPEPSPELREGVETRRHLCIQCNELLTGQQRKFCSNKCRTLEFRIRTGKIKKPGVGSGGNQWGVNNHQYKTGVGTFRRLAFEAYPNKCNRCQKSGELEKLLVHHIDEDRTNNKIENLEILCKRCHQNHHCIRDSLGRFTKIESNT